MPQVTVYIREEDLSKWKSLEKKSEFIHNALNNTVLKTSTDMTEDDFRRANETPDERDVMDAPKVIKTPKDAEKAVKAFVGVEPELVPPVAKNIPRSSNGLCKIHGTPLDNRGKCLQKGCKYA